MNLKTLPADYDSFTSRVELKAELASTLAGLVGWFDLEMNSLTNLSTAPDMPPTHWKQVFFPLKEKVELDTGETIVLWFDYQPALENYRGMMVDIAITKAGRKDEIKQKYVMV